jgi:Tol biopolymer transport system component
MWSPDGKTIACAGGSSSGERLSNIYAVSVETGAAQPISDRKWRAIERGAWLEDGSGIIAAAMDVQGQEAFQIWEFPFPGGEPRRITNDLNDYGGVSLTADAKTLVTIQFEVRRNIWLLPNLETKQAVSLTDGRNDSFRFVSWAPDKKIVYPSLESGTRDIWTMDAGGGNRKQLTATAHNDILPVASADNRYIVFASNRAASGTVNIWRINADGTNPVQLTFGNDESQPSVTPDGKSVIYTSGGNDAEPEKRTVWKVSIDGGEPVQLTTSPSFGADISPDGNQFVCRYKENQTSTWRAAVIPIDGGQPTKFLDVAQGSPLRWSPDGAAITFIKTQNGVSNIWSQPLSGDAAKQLTDFTAEQIFFFDWSDDNQMVCSRGITTQEAVLISDFR